LGIHKHKDGDKFTPLSFQRADGLHGHGDQYSPANAGPTHTHLNKNTKQRTAGPIGSVQKEEGANMPSHTPAEKAKKKKKKTIKVDKVDQEPVDAKFTKKKKKKKKKK